MTIHALDKEAFKCDFCGKIEETENEMTKHLFDSHSERTREGLLQCDECEYKCKESADLIVHTKSN